MRHSHPALCWSLTDKISSDIHTISATYRVKDTISTSASPLRQALHFTINHSLHDGEGAQCHRRAASQRKSCLATDRSLLARNTPLRPQQSSCSDGGHITGESVSPLSREIRESITYIYSSATELVLSSPHPRTACVHSCKRLYRPSL